MLAKRWQDFNDEYDDEYFENELPHTKPTLKAVSQTPEVLDKSLRSRCQTLFILFAILAMTVTIRSGICASYGYALVETQQEAQKLEQENERLKIEIAQLKSPHRIKAIAEEELGMHVPTKTYFAH